MNGMSAIKTIAERELAARRKVLIHCACRGLEGEWQRGCNCLCHYTHMDAVHGWQSWTRAQWLFQSAPRF